MTFRWKHHGKNLIKGTTLTNYIKNAIQDPSWKDFFHAFRETLSELKAAQKFKDINRRNIFARLRTAYMGIIWRDLSIDLVAASLRQREFARKITSEECHGIDSPFALSKATTRYHKFLLLLKRSENPLKTSPHLVPTLDIDLCWHTHQLFPLSYQGWCLTHLGRAINHDDTIKKTNLTAGLRLTSLAWLEAYREPYTTDDMKKAYLTTGRKLAGIIFPQYGLHVLSKGRKLDQARTGISNFLFLIRVNAKFIVVEDDSEPLDRKEYHDGRSYAHMSMYPYWTIYPYGWGYYPAACASIGQGADSWGPGVCGTSNEYSNAEGAACGSGQCGGGSSACAGSSGNCSSGNCSGGGGGSGGGCGGGGCGGGCSN